MFDPIQLRSFRELAVRGTMAAVAEALSLSPSAVSQQVAALERAAAVKLVEPDGRRVRLTAAGQALVRHADAILLALREAADEVSALGADEAGTLRLASFPTAAAALCPALIRGLAERHPHHQVTLIEADTTASISTVASGETDVALVDELDLPLAGGSPALARQEIHADPLYCVLPADHRLQACQQLGLRDLAEEAWILDHPTCSFHRITLDLCHAAGFQPRVVAHTGSVNVATALVRSGAGCAILPGLALTNTAGLLVRPITPPVRRRLYAVYRTGAAARPSVATAIDLLRETATRAHDLLDASLHGRGSVP